MISFNALFVLPLAHILSVWEGMVTSTRERVVIGMCALSVLLNAYLLYQAGVLLSPWCLVARVVVFAVVRAILPRRPYYPIADVLAPVVMFWFAGNVLHDWRQLLVQLSE